MLHHKQQSGFSMVEFIVILTLFAIMASVVTFDFQQYRSRIDRSTTSTDIALAYRQMQVYGISSSNRIIGGEGFEQDDTLVSELVSEDLILDTSSYGVQFDFDTQSFTLYQEVGGDPLAYDDGTDLLIDLLELKGENQIIRICATEGDTEPAVHLDGSCSFTLANPGEEIELGTFSTVFKRPFPDARFAASSVGSGFEPTMLIMEIGPEGSSADQLRYVYFDAVGLIQTLTPVID